ncbi:MAG: ImmA/IrrE family metallo-endopeptidase [Patescibacteria group bacterium]
MESSPDYKKCEDIATELLEKYVITEPVVNVFEIAKSEGLGLKFVQMPEALKNVAGFLSDKTIYINKEDPTNRQVFTVAHELGHFELKHDPKEYKVLLRLTLQNREYDVVEKEANCFAANILVPEKMLNAVIKKYQLASDNVDIIASMFGVSKEMMEYRMKRLKLWQNQLA